jgi:hypothetical protein
MTRNYINVNATINTDNMHKFISGSVNIVGAPEFTYYYFELYFGKQQENTKEFL